MNVYNSVKITNHLDGIFIPNPNYLLIFVNVLKVTKIIKLDDAVPILHGLRFPILTSILDFDVHSSIIRNLIISVFRGGLTVCLSCL
jgi:hypothetical protein